MRKLEPTLLALITISMVLSQLSILPGTVVRLGLAGFLGLMFILQCVMKLPWTMIPAWLAGALTAAALFINWQAPVLIFIIGGLLLLISMLLVIFLPVFVIPTPAGKYSVGTEVYNWVDEKRDDLFMPGSKRELVVRLFYPAAPEKGMKPELFLEHAAEIGAALLENAELSIKLPGFLASHFSIPKTHAYLNAPVAGGDQPFPVVFFSHGLGSIDLFNIQLLENLASLGYVAVSINHTHSSMAARFNDGRIFNFKNTPSDLRDDALPPEVSPARAARLDQWVEDAMFVMDQLVLIQSGEIKSRVSGRLDLEKTAISGHSFGGNTTGNVCQRDARFKTGVILDGTWDRRSHVQQPMMIFEAKREVKDYEKSITSEDLEKLHMTYEEAVAYIHKMLQADTQYFLDVKDADTYRVVVHQALHYDFTEADMISPLFRLFKITGTMPRGKSFQLVYEYVIAFLNHYLKGIPSPLLDGTLHPYPLIEMNKYP